MEYEWDEAKRRSNLAKHGVDFSRSAVFGWETAVRFPDLRREYGELRWLALGYIGHRLHAMVYTKSGSRVRVISLRKASEKEGLRYGQERARQQGRGSGDPAGDRG